MRPHEYPKPFCPVCGTDGCAHGGGVVEGGLSSAGVTKNDGGETDG